MSSETIIEVENLSKQYRLGQVSTGTISHDLNRAWCRLRGKEDPYLQVTQSNDREKKAETLKTESLKGRRTPFQNFSLSKFQDFSSDYVWALNDINFEVKRGEVLGIIGRNGAGKSTLLKILSRVTAPTTGEIRVDGRIASLLEVGTGFHPELTGRENIFLNGSILGMTKAEIKSKLDEIVEFSGCARYLDTPVKRYSSGMMVRLGFAVAAHLEPEILIVDEVLAVGDAEFQKKCIGKMKDVASHGRTVLFVSHNLGAVSDLCQRGIVLSNGCVVFSGSVDDAVTNYVQGVSTGGISQNSFSGDLKECFLLHSIQINGVSITNGSAMIAPSEPFVIDVEYSLKTSIPFICCISIGAGRCNRLFTIHDEPTAGCSVSGKYVSSFCIDPNPLRPDQYVVHVGGYSGPDRGCTWVWGSAVGHFGVMESWSETVQWRDVGQIWVPASTERSFLGE